MNNILLNLFASVVLFIFLFDLLRREKNFLNGLLAALILCNITALISDILGRCDGFAYSFYPAFNRIGNFILFCTDTAAPSCFLLYLYEYIYKKKSFNRKLIVFLVIFNLLNLCLIAVSPSTHFLYYIDSANIYHRGRFCLVGFMLPVIIMLVAFYLICINISRITWRETMTFLVYILLPFSAIIIQVMYYGMSLIFEAMTISIVMICVNLQTELYLRAVQERDEEHYEVESIQESYMGIYKYNPAAKVFESLKVIPQYASLVDSKNRLDVCSFVDDFVRIEDKDRVQQFLSEENIRQVTSSTEKVVCDLNYGEERGKKQEWRRIQFFFMPARKDVKSRLLLMISDDSYVRKLIERNQWLTELSEHDRLTMLYNRTKYQSMLRTVYRQLESCGILFFDLNFLKITNDKYGHEAGDELIQIAAKSIRTLENNDIHAYRFGGDEMVVVMCNCRESEPDKLIEVWRENLETLNKTARYPCSMAVGKAWDSGGYLNIEALISRADEMMYINKRQMEALRV